MAADGSFGGAKLWSHAVLDLEVQGLARKALGLLPAGRTDRRLLQDLKNQTWHMHMHMQCEVKQRKNLVSNLTYD